MEAAFGTNRGIHKNTVLDFSHIQLSELLWIIQAERFLAIFTEFSIFDHYMNYVFQRKFSSFTTLIFCRFNKLEFKKITSNEIFDYSILVKTVFQN